jgi:hypothetical protein
MALNHISDAPDEALNHTSDAPDEARSDRIGEIAHDRRAPTRGAPTEGIRLGDGMMGLGLKISDVHKP